MSALRCLSGTVDLESDEVYVSASDPGIPAAVTKTVAYPVVIVLRTYVHEAC